MSRTVRGISGNNMPPWGREGPSWRLRAEIEACTKALEEDEADPACLP